MVSISEQSLLMDTIEFWLFFRHHLETTVNHIDNALLVIDLSQVEEDTVFAISFGKKS
jgi:hypothetical protein